MERQLNAIFNKKEKRKDAKRRSWQLNAEVFTRRRKKKG